MSIDQELDRRGLHRNSTQTATKNQPRKSLPTQRNAGGQKRPFTPEQVRLIRDVLRAEGSLRDLALFCVGIDTLLRGVDLLALSVRDVMAPDGSFRDELNVRQAKTASTVRVALSAHSHKALDEWISASKKTYVDLLFTREKGDRRQPITPAYYRKLVKRWAQLAHLDPAEYASHSLRRTKAARIYERTLNIEIVRQLLGHKSISSTPSYLNIGQREALDAAKKIEI